MEKKGRREKEKGEKIETFFLSHSFFTFFSVVPFWKLQKGIEMLTSKGSIFNVFMIRIYVFVRWV